MIPSQPTPAPQAIVSESANPADLAWHHLAVQPTGIVYVGASCYLNQGREVGEIVDDTGAVVGHIYWPVDGAVWIRGPGMELDWNAGSLDSNADGFISGDDKDLWDWWWWYGWPMADWNMDGFVTGDDKDAHDGAWFIGVGN